MPRRCPDGGPFDSLSFTSLWISLALYMQNTQEPEGHNMFNETSLYFKFTTKGFSVNSAEFCFFFLDIRASRPNKSI